MFTVPNPVMGIHDYQIFSFPSAFQATVAVVCKMAKEFLGSTKIPINGVESRIHFYQTLPRPISTQKLN